MTGEAAALGGGSRAGQDILDLEDALQHLLGAQVDVVSLGALLARDTEIRQQAVAL